MCNNCFIQRLLHTLLKPRQQLICSAIETKLSMVKIRSCQSYLTWSASTNYGARICRSVSPLVSIRYHSRGPVVKNTMNEEELNNFRKLSDAWWNESGEFETLHLMNKLRVPFIRDGLLNHCENLSDDPTLPLKGLTLLDAGSGGGLLTEPLARLGAFVVGVDPVEESAIIAQHHLEQDPAILPRVKYITGTVEDLVTTEAEKFDGVIASEVVEHVSNVSTFIQSCSSILKPGGSLFITTMNKTMLSRCLAVFAAENILRIIPKGTHDWDKFIPPEDLKSLLEKNNVHTRLLHGLQYIPVLRKWIWTNNTSISYALHAVKAPKEMV